MLFRRTQSSTTLDYTAGEKLHTSVRVREVEPERTRTQQHPFPPPDSTQVAGVPMHTGWEYYFIFLEKNGQNPGP